MAEDPSAHPPGEGNARQSLEELVYRSSLAEGNRALRRASPWLTLPVCLAVCGLVAGLGTLLARAGGSREPVVQSVAVVLQEPAEPPPPAAPAPAEPAAAPAAASAPPAPSPGVPSPEALPPPPPVAQAAPDTAPAILPQEDQSRKFAGHGGAGTGDGGAPGTGSGGSGGGVGAGPGGGPRLVEIDRSRAKLKNPEPPPYPAMAVSARIQGSVVVRITLDASGVPVSAVAEQGPYLLRKPAEAYALTRRWEPYLVNGVPVAGTFLLTVTYNLNGIK